MTAGATNNNGGFRMSSWSLISIVGSCLILTAFALLRAHFVVSEPGHELRTLRGEVDEAMLALESARSEGAIVLDSVNRLRAARSDLTRNLDGLRSEVGRLQAARNQYYSDTYARVINDLGDEVLRRIETLEMSAVRAQEYPEILTWFETGREIDGRYPVPEVDTIYEATALAEESRRQQPYEQEANRHWDRVASLIDAGADPRKWTPFSDSARTAFDSAQIHRDSVMSILKARVDRAGASSARLTARSDWWGSPPTSWPEWRFAVIPDLSVQTTLDRQGSPLTRLRAFEVALAKGDTPPLKASELFEQTLDNRALDRLLADDRQRAEAVIRAFIDEHALGLGVPLEARVSPLDPSAVRGEGTRVVEDLREVRRLLRLFRVELQAAVN